MSEVALIVVTTVHMGDHDETHKDVTLFDESATVADLLQHLKAYSNIRYFEVHRQTKAKLPSDEEPF